MWTEYEVWFCDDDGNIEEWCAASDAIKEAKHYAIIYGQDGPVKIVKVVREIIG